MAFSRGYTTYTQCIINYIYGQEDNILAKRNGDPFGSVCSPQLAPSASGKPGAPSLIEGAISLPGLTQLRSKSYLAQLYAGQHLSGRQIARLTEISRSTAFAALQRTGIPQDGRNRTHPGQLPFGYDYQNFRLVKNQAEQGVIRLTRQDRAAGL
jgi:hypothetical protein